MNGLASFILDLIGYWLTHTDLHQHTFYSQKLGMCEKGYARTEITSTGLGTTAMMITAKLLITRRAAAGPAESLRPVIVELLFGIVHFALCLGIY
jgi:hypothetical protein